MMYERVCMVTKKYKNFEKMLGTIVVHNYDHNAQLSNEKLRQAVSKVMEETQEEELDAKFNANNVTMDNFFQQSPVTTNTQE